MTGAATAVLDGVVLVLPLEARLVDLVTLDAERGFGVDEELSVLLRDVGTVALEAVLLHRFVLELAFGDGLAQLLVASEAEGTPGLDQDHLVVRAVRVMALGALPLGKDFVNAPTLRLLQLVVTLVAEGSRSRGEKLLVVRGVRVVAARAVPLGKRSVQVLALQCFLEAVVTPIPVRFRR